MTAFSSVPATQLAFPLGGLPDRPRPMRAAVAAEPFDSPRYVFEAKWGCVRVMASIVRGRAVFRTISGRDITAVMPDLARRVTKAIGMDGVVLDGEIVFRDSAGRSDPARAMRLITGGEDEAGLDPPVFHVGDVLYNGYRPVTGLPLVDRKRILEEIVAPDDAVQTAYYHDEEGTVFFEAARALGVEGMLAKVKTSRYRMGAVSKDWLDISDRRTADVVIGGFTMGGADAREPFQTLLVGAYDGGALHYLGGVSGGFSAEDREALQRTLSGVASDQPYFANPPQVHELLYWCEPSVVAHIEYGEAGADGRLHFGRFICLRSDMTPADSIAPVRVRGAKRRG